jgi:D-glycero-alpha-D-manno-heptose-7-phosphate kinase
MIITRTPFRISLFGGGTDYPEWYSQHGGSVISATINKYCYITLRELLPFYDHRIRLVYAQQENVQLVREITHPTVRAVFSALRIESGVEMHHDADLPAGTGMGTSSSFTVGLLQAASLLTNKKPMSAVELACLSVYLERNVVGECVGIQDQYAAAFGGVNYFEINRLGDVASLGMPYTHIKELERSLLLFYTGIRRHASTVAQTYQFAESATHFHQQRDITRAGASAIEKGDIREVGILLHNAWMAKQNYSSKVASSRIHELYNLGLVNGAYGGKLLGAGAGGFLLFCAPTSAHTQIKSAMLNAGLLHVPFEFTDTGVEIILGRTK